MISDRLSREYVVVDITVSGEAPTDPVSMAILSGATRPANDLSDFIQADVDGPTARLLIAMSNDASDTNEDKILAGEGDYGVWILVDGVEQIVRRVGTLTVE